MVTMYDLIRKGIIKEYIPPKAVTTKSLKKKPRASPVLQEVFPQVFSAWVSLDTQTKKSRQCSVRNASGGNKR